MGNARKRVPPSLSPLCLHVVQIARFAAHRERDGAAADGAVFDGGVVTLRSVDRRREILTAPRAGDFGFDEIGHVARVGLQLELQSRGVAPQILEAVEGALFGVENVHDYIGIVRDDPLAEREAIHGQRLEVLVFPEFVAQFAGDGLEVRLGRAGANDEEVREADDATEINGDDVLGFFFREEVRAETG